VKKLVPIERSRKSKIIATVKLGKANRIKKDWTRIVQTKMGMRLRDIPGARMRRIVTARLMAVATEETPVNCNPSTQKSIPVVGEYGFEVRGT
jgi:hypothetical protein